MDTQTKYISQLPKFSPEYLREILTYEPDTGIFYWRKGRPHGRNGFIPYDKPAGGLTNSGYINICIGGREFPAHRLAWYMTHDEWAPGPVDHIDQDRTNNKLSNLRKATYSQNGMNSKLSSSNTSGTTGVCFHKVRRMWEANIKVDFKKIHLGEFKNKEDAINARLLAERIYFGEFSPNADVPISKLLKQFKEGCAKRSTKNGITTIRLG